jgi:hypothetical protein
MPWLFLSRVPYLILINPPLFHYCMVLHLIFGGFWLMCIEEFEVFPVLTVCISSVATRGESNPGRIVFDVFPFQSQILNVCRNVCNHLPSNIASYNRRKGRLFIPLWKPKISRNCINLSPNWIAYNLLYLNRPCHCKCNFRLCSVQLALSPTAR